MVSKELFQRILDKKLKKYPEWIRADLREDLLSDFEKFKKQIEAEFYL